MYAIHPIVSIPGNLVAYLDEIQQGITGLYGKRTGEEYARRLEQQMAGSLAHPSLNGYGAFAVDGHSDEVAAMALTVYRDGIGRFAFLHVLKSHRERGAEGLLVEEAVARLRDRGAWGITAEPAPLCPLDVAGPFDRLGFACFPRVVMTVPLTPSTFPSPERPGSVPLRSDAFHEAADVITTAYEGHSDRDIQPEVRSPKEALHFVVAAAHGAYGEVGEGYLRICRRDGIVAAVIVGSRSSSEMGFIVQVAVRPAYQGQGLGSILLRDVAAVFQKDGIRMMGLGVTATNPARRLYARLGFRPRRSIKAYVWWKDQGWSGGNSVEGKAVVVG